MERSAPALSLAVIDIHSLLDTEAVVLTSRLPRELMQYFIQLMEVILEQEYQLDLGQSLPKLLEGRTRSDFHARCSYGPLLSTICHYFFNSTKTNFLNIDSSLYFLNYIYLIKKTSLLLSHLNKSASRLSSDQASLSKALLIKLFPNDSVVLPQVC